MIGASLLRQNENQKTEDKWMGGRIDGTGLTLKNVVTWIKLVLAVDLNGSLRECGLGTHNSIQFYFYSAIS